MHQKGLFVCFSNHPHKKLLTCFGKERWWELSLYPIAVKSLAFSSGVISSSIAKNQKPTKNCTLIRNDKHFSCHLFSIVLKFSHISLILHIALSFILWKFTQKQSLYIVLHTYHRNPYNLYYKSTHNSSDENSFEEYY